MLSCFTYIVPLTTTSLHVSLHHHLQHGTMLENHFFHVILSVHSEYLSPSFYVVLLKLSFGHLIFGGVFHFYITFSLNTCSPPETTG